MSFTHILHAFKFRKCLLAVCRCVRCTWVGCVHAHVHIACECWTCFQSIFKYVHGFPPWFALTFKVSSWIEKISHIFIFPSGFCCSHWGLIWAVHFLLSDSSHSTEQFWAFFLHFGNFSITPLFLLIHNFFLLDISWFLVISRRFLLALSISLPPPRFPAPLFAVCCPLKLSAPRSPLLLPEPPGPQRLHCPPSAPCSLPRPTPS